MGGERVTSRWRPGELPAFVVPFVVGVFQVVGSTGAGHRMHYQPRHLDILAYALLIGGPFALTARRRAPAATLTATMAIMVGYILLGYVVGPIFLSVLVAVGATVVAGRRVAAWTITISGWTVLNGVGLFTPFGPFRWTTWTSAHVLASLTWSLLILIGSELVRIRSERAAEVRRTRAEEARRQASEERLRIARELHDVLAHNISMINVQAGVALHLMDERPEQARTALSVIKDASKDALAEVRSVLGVLRQVDESAPRSPAAGLDRIDDLVARARLTGITVRAGTTGAPRPLPTGVDLTAFRIIQEALTNVTRHAGPGVTATVRVAYGDDDLRVEVTDDGRGAPIDLPQGGNGIPGMRERVAALGGDLTAAPRDGVPGFHVRARFPVGPATNAPTGAAAGRAAGGDTSGTAGEAAAAGTPGGRPGPAAETEEDD